MDDYMWTDIEMHGKVDPLEIWKVDGDPWVAKNILPRGGGAIEDIVLIPQTSSTLATLPTQATAWKHSVVVKNFGDGLTARMIVEKLNDCTADDSGKKLQRWYPSVQWT